MTRRPASGNAAWASKGPSRVPSAPGWDPFGTDIDADSVLAAVADWLAPHPAPARRVVVPDVRGLFTGPCLRAIGDIGRHMQTIS
jgi:hypothetical protein